MVCIGGSIGKSAIVKHKITFNQQLNALSPIYMDSVYLNLTMRSSVFQKLLIEKSTGSATPIINRGKWEMLLVSVPPLEEQKRIVSKVEELMELCDKLEEEQTNNLKTHEVLVKTILETLTQANDGNELQEAWKRMTAHFDTLFCTEDSIEQLKQTILQLAVMGKLVKQDPNDEGASSLLKKIAAEKVKLIKEERIKKQKPLPKISVEDRPFELPESWEWVPWSNILAYDNYAFKRGPFGSSLKKDMFVEKGYKVYEQYCPINDDCSFERYYITDELFKTLEGFAVKADDYLVSCSGATLGRITQVPDDFKEGIINQALLRVRINHKYVDKDFFKLLFRSPYFQIMIRDNSKGSAIPNVKGVKDLKAMAIPFFHINEQRKIVKKIETLYSICDSLKNKTINSQKIKGNLSRTIIEKAVQ
jgi:type I restriction enzyme S subunit